MEVLKDNKKPSQVAKAYGVHPNSISKWPKTVLEEGPELFAQDGTVAEYERRIAELAAVVDGQMVYYNTSRRHSSIGYVPPLTYFVSGRR
jgi:transposase-like protein